jgi:hypothetical protein
MIAGLFCSTVAFALYPLLSSAWQAFPIGILSGAGAGTWLTMQSSLLAAITLARLRPAAFAQQRVAANVGLGGLVGGLIVTTSNPGTFTTLFVVDALTFLAYTLFLARVPVPPVEAGFGRPRGYREVLRDRPFVRFAGVNLLFIVSTVSMLNGLRRPLHGRDGVLLAARFHRRAGSRRCGVGRGAARALADHGRALARRRALLVVRRAAAAGGSEAKPEAGETASS